jgi:hypothetical protein
MDIEVIVIIGLSVVIFMLVDSLLYATSPFEIRHGHWWSYIPGSGFVAKFIEWKSK